MHNTAKTRALEICVTPSQLKNGSLRLKSHPLYDWQISLVNDLANHYLAPAQARSAGAAIIECLSSQVCSSVANLITFPDHADRIVTRVLAIPEGKQMRHHVYLLTCDERLWRIHPDVLWSEGRLNIGKLIKVPGTNISASRNPVVPFLELAALADGVVPHGHANWRMAAWVRCSQELHDPDVNQPELRRFLAELTEKVVEPLLDATQTAEHEAVTRFLPPALGSRLRRQHHPHATGGASNAQVISTSLVHLRNRFQAVREYPFLRAFFKETQDGQLQPRPLKFHPRDIHRPSSLSLTDTRRLASAIDEGQPLVPLLQQLLGFKPWMLRHLRRWPLDKLDGYADGIPALIADLGLLTPESAPHNPEDMKALYSLFRDFWDDDKPNELRRSLKGPLSKADLRVLRGLLKSSERIGFLTTYLLFLERAKNWMVQRTDSNSKASCNYVELLGTPTLSEWAHLARHLHKIEARVTRSLESLRGDPHDVSIRKAICWPVLFDAPVTIGRYEFFCLGSQYDLDEEGREMRHCAGNYGRPSLAGECHVISVREDGRRRATLMLDVITDDSGLSSFRMSQLEGEDNDDPPNHAHAHSKVLVRKLNAREIVVRRQLMPDTPERKALEARALAALPNGYYLGWIEHSFATFLGLYARSGVEAVSWYRKALEISPGRGSFYELFLSAAKNPVLRAPEREEQEGEVAIALQRSLDEDI